jgi:hypothetical protein
MSIDNFFFFFFCIDRTATVEGTEMKQVLSTFSKLEQSRFEAFRKASFPGDAIGTYVAHCLIHEQHRSISTGDIDKSTSSSERGGGNEEAAVAVATNTSTASIVSNSTRLRYLRPTTATATAATGERRKKEPILSDVVATGQSGDITVVVSTLAKAYAQRLVLAARKYSIERRNRHKISSVHDENSNNDDDEEEEEEEEEDIAISPEDILTAYADREVRGLDPGFFLQARGTKNNSGSSNSGCTNVNLLLTDTDQRYTLNRSVVLSAQDDYYNNMKNENDNDNDRNNDSDNDNDNDNMEIDVDDEHNNNNGDTTNDNNVVADKDKGGNDEKSNNDDDDDDDDDPVDESVKLFSLLVNQINARQSGGITVTALSSSDYDNSIGTGIGSDIIADSSKSNKLGGNKNELEKEGVIVDENINDKKKGISNINTENNVTATELVAVPIDTSSDGTTTTNTTPTTINNDSTEDATTTLATTNITTIDTKNEEDNAE